MPPLPGELSPGGEGHWGPPGSYGQPPAGPPPSHRPLSRALVYVVVAVLAAAVGAGAVFALRGSAGPAPSSATSSQDIPKPAQKPGSSSGSLNQTVASKVEPGLVDITSFVHYQQQVFEGTGMVLTSNGLALTNNHVIKGSTERPQVRRPGRRHRQRTGHRAAPADRGVRAEDRPAR